MANSGETGQYHGPERQSLHERVGVGELRRAKTSAKRLFRQGVAECASREKVPRSLGHFREDLCCRERVAFPAKPTKELSHARS